MQTKIYPGKPWLDTNGSDAYIEWFEEWSPEDFD